MSTANIRESIQDRAMAILKSHSPRGEYEPPIELYEELLSCSRDGPRHEYLERLAAFCDRWPVRQ